MMDERNFQLVLIFLAGVIALLILVILGLGAWFVVLPAVTTTTTTSTTTTTTTSTTTTTTTSTTTTTTSTTTTLRKVYVCSSRLSKTEMVVTRCYGKNSGEYYNASMKSRVDYVLSDATFGEYMSNRMIIENETCHYALDKISFTVGSFSTCEIPKNRTCTENADLVLI